MKEKKMLGTFKIHVLENHPLAASSQSDMFSRPYRNPWLSCVRQCFLVVFFPESAGATIITVTPVPSRFLLTFCTDAAVRPGAGASCDLSVAASERLVRNGWILHRSRAAAIYANGEQLCCGLDLQRRRMFTINFALEQKWPLTLLIAVDVLLRGNKETRNGMNGSFLNQKCCPQCWQ